MHSLQRRSKTPREANQSMAVLVMLGVAMAQSLTGPLKEGGFTLTHGFRLHSHQGRECVVRFTAKGQYGCYGLRDNTVNPKLAFALNKINPESGGRANNQLAESNHRGRGSPGD